MFDVGIDSISGRVWCGGWRIVLLLRMCSVGCTGSQVKRHYKVANQLWDGIMSLAWSEVCMQEVIRQRHRLSKDTPNDTEH